MTKISWFLCIWIIVILDSTECRNMSTYTTQKLCPPGQYSSLDSFGLSYSCINCPCPGISDCIQLGDQQILCLNCPKGYSGQLCQKCADGYFGDPDGNLTGNRRMCQPCNCFNNTNVNEPGNCNRITGKCSNCMYNTAGEHCQYCAPGFYGKAKTPGGCKPCQCNNTGSVEPINGIKLLQCDQENGNCSCKPNVLGQKCDQCASGYYNFDSGRGCQKCDCDPNGSIGLDCNNVTGQCNCKPGVSGTKCNVCASLHYNLTTKGCLQCNCDKYGSKSLQCDRNGNCLCQNYAKGKNCDQCKLINKYSKKKGCIDCPKCYDFVKETYEVYKQKLSGAIKELENIKPNITIDSDFEEKFNKTKIDIELLKLATIDTLSNNEDKLKNLTYLVNNLKDSLKSLPDILENLNKLQQDSFNSNMRLENNNLTIKDILSNAGRELKRAIEYIKTDGRQALLAAQEKTSEVQNSSDYMKDIAEQSKALAERLEINQMRIDILKSNYSQSCDKVVTHFEAFDKIISTKNNTQSLINQTIIDAAKTEIDKLSLISDKLYEDMLDVYMRSKQMLEEVNNTTVPNNTLGIDNRLKERLAISNRIITEAEDFLDGPHIYNQVKNEIAEAKLGDRFIELQSILKDWLDQVKNSNNIAKENIALAERIMAKAKENLYNLLTFHENLQKNKNAAEDAISNDKPKLIEDFNKISSLIEMLERVLLAAMTNLDYANKASDEVQQEGQKINQDAENLNKTANDVQNAAREIEQELEFFNANIDEYNIRADTVNDLFNKNADDLEPYKNYNTSNFPTDMDSYQKKLNQNLSELDEIKKKLSNFENLDSKSLSHLEERIEDLERQMNNIDVPEKVEQIEIDIEKATKWIEMQTNEKKNLELELSNVKLIADSLEAKCFKSPQTQR